MKIFKSFLFCFILFFIFSPGLTSLFNQKLMAIFAKTIFNRNIVVLFFFCLFVCFFFAKSSTFLFSSQQYRSRSRRLEWQQDAGQWMLSIRTKGMLCAWTVSYAVLCLLEQWCMIIGYTAWRKQYYIYLCIYQKVYIIFGDVDFTPRLYSLYPFLSGRPQCCMNEFPLAA